MDEPAIREGESGDETLAPFPAKGATLRSAGLRSDQAASFWSRSFRSTGLPALNGSPNLENSPPTKPGGV